MHTLSGTSNNLQMNSADDVELLAFVCLLLNSE